jgi:hypothetical protein
MANRGPVQGRRRYLRCLTFVCVRAVADWIRGREQRLTGVKVYVHAEDGAVAARPRGSWPANAVAIVAASRLRNWRNEEAWNVASSCTGLH